MQFNMHSQKKKNINSSLYQNQIIANGQVFITCLSDRYELNDEFASFSGNL